ncbi:hypothetical protein GCM10010844_23200 [Deinococcus radiotolerans]|uniref:DUF11 domain-containing protein n=1 Tax=Deinococcus radiotolerans TaxID=1309407 RepID=A0ABQ2FJD3_9DEIO|nr:hypothetical protein GCM10010844_23200 [Deinococcus radiotolerans]
MISKGFSPASVSLGSTTQLTISVTNPNGVSAQNFTLTDDVAATTGLTGLTITAVGSDTCRGAGSTSVLNGRYVLSGGTLPAAGCAVTLTVQLPSSATVGPATNTILGSSVSGSINGQPLPTPADATAALTVTAADLNVIKAGPPFARPGEVITYTLTVTNGGSAEAASTTLTDQLPNGVTLSSSSPSAAVTGTTLSWTLGTLAPGASQTFTVTVRAPDLTALASTPATRSLLNTAQVTTTSPESTTSNNASVVTTRMIAAQLIKLVRNVSTGTAFAASGGGVPGETLEYCIQVRNVGAVDLPAFTLADDVPLNTTVQLSAYDAEAAGAGAAGTALGVKLTRGTTSYLTSAADTDAGTLTGAGGAFTRGALTVNLGTLVTADQGNVCFRAVIR